jgi:hypothetical protein
MARCAGIELLTIGIRPPLAQQLKSRSGEMKQQAMLLVQAGMAAALMMTDAGRLEAADWASKMFDKTAHNFGTVARGADTEHRFQIKNLYKEDMTISSVRTSCGCATPTLTKRTLKSGETAELIAKYNTDRFIGQHGATITVRFGGQFSAEVRLRVDGYIRRDVVFKPSRIELGSINAGAGAKQTVKVAYAGRSDWQIAEVRTANEHVVVEAEQTSRSNGRVEYALHFTLKPDAPPGYINEPITLVTNDRSLQTLTLPVEGRVVSSVTISPPLLQLGVLQPGQSVTKQLVVRSQTPFRISKVTCEGSDDCFRIEPGDKERKVHLIPVTFTASEKTGSFVETIRIEADGMDSTIPVIVANVEVRAE